MLINGQFLSILIQYGKHLLAITLIIFSFFVSAHAGKSRIGVLSFESANETQVRWRATADQLGAIINSQIFEIIPLDYDALNLAVKNHEIDFVLTNPEHYVVLRNVFGLSPLATLNSVIDSHAIGKFGSTIFTTAANPNILGLTDVKGHRVAAVGLYSLGGFLAAADTFRKNSIDLQSSDVRSLSFLGTPHNRVVDAVLAGSADVGIVRTGVLEQMAKQGSIDLSRIRVLNLQPSSAFPQALSTELFPEWPMAVMPEVDPNLAKSVAIALMQIQPKSLAAVQGRYQGFYPPANYAAVEELMRRLEVYPNVETMPLWREIWLAYSSKIQIAGLLLFLLGFLSTSYLFGANRKLRRLTGLYEDSQKLLSDVIESLPYGLAVFDDQQCLQTYNKKYIENLRLEELISDKSNHHFSKIIAYLYARGDYGFEKNVDQIIETFAGFMIRREYVTARRRQFDSSYIEFRAVPISNNWTALTYLDITEQVSNEQKATDSYKLMIAAIDAVDEAFVMYDAEDRMTYCNNKYRELYASTADLIVYGVKFEDLIREGAERGIYLDAVGRVDEFVAERTAAHQSGNLGVITHLDDGRVMRVIDRKLPNGYIVGFRIDITELAFAKNQAEQLATAKGQFLANMSHEIRTPMNAIIGLLNLLQSTELTARQRDYATKSESAAKSLLGILNDILDFSKVEAGKMTLESEPFQVDELLRNLSVLLSANVGSKNIEILFDIAPDLPAVLRGDSMRLQQVLLNLCGNAVKFTSVGQVILSLRKRTQSSHAVTIEFAVQDTGIGIAPEYQKHIFSGFAQAEGSTTRRFGGTGLGLAISQRFVQLMGGDITINSEQGIGSTFAFTLEMPAVESSTLPLDETNSQQIKAISKPGRVLVVDDNPIAAGLTHRMASSWGWAVDMVSSGTEAIAHLSAQCDVETPAFPYSVIYMDWKMPGMDGWETTHQIRELALRKGLPQPLIIMLTAHDRDMLSQRTEGEQGQIDGFLVKPVTPSMLYDAWKDAKKGKSAIHKVTKGRSCSRQLIGMRILVVEDNLINQQVAEELLSSEGAIVSLAANGQLGVDSVAAAAPQFDVVLMDLQMPVLDGYGATRVIRDELKLNNLPIVAMTANAMASDREACLKAGMNDHIGKPFDMVKLISLLLRVTGFHSDVCTERPDSLSPPLVEIGAIPEVQGLDIQTALDRMSGMRSLYLRTAREFVKFMETVVPEIQHSLQTGDKQQAVMQMHTLKGNAGTLGATDLAAEAARLEKLCKSEVGMTECETALGPFEGLIRETQSKIREVITLMGAKDTNRKSAKSAAHSAKITSNAAERALHNISAMAKAADLEALQVFSETRALLFDAFPTDSMETLEEALQELDLEATSAICDQLLQEAIR